MDCEKFEATLIDELYDELDELTSAAAKRHAAGCARCAAMLSGLRATRRLVTLPPVEPPDGLEERILAAAREAQKVVPIRSRFARAVSFAGSWAMRPQTAMAAVFLLMIGSSVLLLKGRHAAPAGSMRVTEQGAPAEAAEPDPDSDREVVDSKVAAAAHGPQEQRQALPASPAPPPDTAFAAPDRGQLAAADSDESVHNGYGRRGAVSSGAEEGRGFAAPPSRELSKEAARRRGEGDDGVGAELAQGDTLAGSIRGAPAPREGRSGAAAAPSPWSSPGGSAPPATGGAIANRDDQANGVADRTGAPMQAAANAETSLGGTANAPAAKRSSAAGAMEAATNAYRARDFATATRLYDEAAAAGDANAALMAARSTREGSGCRAAVGRFDAIVAKHPGTTVGLDAELEAARCYRQMGATEAARQRLSRLLGAPSHAARAQAELEATASPKERKAAPAPAKPASVPSTKEAY